MLYFLPFRLYTQFFSNVTWRREKFVKIKKKTFPNEAFTLNKRLLTPLSVHLTHHTLAPKILLPIYSLPKCFNLYHHLNFVLHEYQLLMQHEYSYKIYFPVYFFYLTMRNLLR